MVPSSDLRQPTDLEELAQAQFAPLSDAEIRLLRAAPRGETAYCGPNEHDDDPNHNPANSDNWGSERWIRAELIRWLCVDRDAKDSMDPRGIRVHAAGIIGKLDLSFLVVPFLLRLHGWSLSDDLDLRFVEIPSMDLSETRLMSLNADHADVKGDILLENLRSSGTVRLRAALIGGSLGCDGARFQSLAKPDMFGRRMALDVRRCPTLLRVRRRGNGRAARVLAT